MRAFYLFAAASLALGWLLPCGADDAPDEATETTCSTGPAVDSGAGIEPWPHSQEDYGALPECVPHCGAEPIGTFGYPLSALPSGACSVNGYECRMGAFEACYDEAGKFVGRGGIHLLACACTAGSWKCMFSIAGSGICTTGIVEAGASD